MTTKIGNYRFDDNWYDGDSIRPRPDLKVRFRPDLRHVEIVKPRSGSHRREGQIYLQSGEYVA